MMSSQGLDLIIGPKLTHDLEPLTVTICIMSSDLQRFVFIFIEAVRAVPIAKFPFSDSSISQNLQGFQRPADGWRHCVRSWQIR